MNPEAARSRTSSVLVLAKRPEPGRVKTRLVPPLTDEQAADVAAACLRDTLDALDDAPQPRTLALDGDPAGWMREGWQYVPQIDGDLDVRIAGAFAAVDPDRPCVLVGMDTPQVNHDDIAVFDPERFDACLGPAQDGGYWALGFAEPRWADQALPGVPMSTARTGEAQLERLTDLGLRVQLLRELTDVDTIDSARRVASLIPDSAFHAALSATGAA